MLPFAFCGPVPEDPEWRQDSQGNWHVAFPEEYWLPIIPSFGISYEF